MWGRQGYDLGLPRMTEAEWLGYWWLREAKVATSVHVGCVCGWERRDCGRTLAVEHGELRFEIEYLQYAYIS